MRRTEQIIDFEATSLAWEIRCCPRCVHDDCIRRDTDGVPSCDWRYVDRGCVLAIEREAAKREQRQ